MVTTYYLWRKRRPNLWVWSPVMLLFIGAMGWIGATRNYWGGLSLDRVEGQNFEDFVTSGFSESGIFVTTCQVIDAVPRNVPHTWGDPFWVALTYPIPRSFWPNKPTSATLDTIAMAFGTEGAAAAGLAVPYFGEWYVAFGWLGIVGSSLIFGWLTRKLWDWYQQRDRDKLALVIYAVGLGLIYFAFSRGFIAATILNFSFSMLPLLIIYRFLPKLRLYAYVLGFPGAKDVSVANKQSPTMRSRSKR